MTDSSLRVGSVSLADLFTGTAKLNDSTVIKGQLTLPEYQRPYRWSANQVAELATDLDRHFKDSEGHDYYLGSLILHQDGEGFLNIIDGQQRITSMGMLSLLAGVTPLPKLAYSAPESQQHILANLAALRCHPPSLSWLTQNALMRINVTLVITDSEDDAYRFFETQNSGGVPLSGIDIAKAHHLRAIHTEQQDTYAKIWEAMGDLQPLVDVAMRGRFWQSIEWRELASRLRQPRYWRDQVVFELAQATGEEGKDLAYHLAVTVRGASALAHSSGNYDLRQPLEAGRNSIHYFQQFQDFLSRYCSKQLPEQAPPPWRELYYELVAKSDASDYLRKLYDAALIIYLSRFGDTALHEAGLWLFRAVYSLRLSNDKMVKENSVQRFVRETPLLDWIAYSYTHTQLVCKLRSLECKVSLENLDNKNGKKQRHIAAVCRVLDFWRAEIDITPELIAQRFDASLCKAIEQCLTPQNLSA
jgi:hypothetical protein